MKQFVLGSRGVQTYNRECEKRNSIVSLDISGADSKKSEFCGLECKT